jgi:hypothetical protein
MYLNITSNEEDGIRDVADVVAATAGQGFLLYRSLAPPSNQGSRFGERSHWDRSRLEQGHRLQIWRPTG